MNDQQTISMPFMRRILKQLDLVDSVDSIEDRFLPDGDKQFLIMLIQSMQKGQKI